ncbi:MAG: hypothetical protein F9K45_02655, partial [Melioribacteraceae bacterium]
MAKEEKAELKRKPQRHEVTKFLKDFFNKFYIVAVIFLYITQTVYGQAQTSEIASMPGAFSRMGFGARGMGMGNAMSAVKYGSIVSYYNPALSAFQEKNNFHTSYSFLSLDRSLNFLN